ncbi:chemotaxis response regulator protein-glutamate methylesterase [Caproiciproducens galactitolivorans]|uniref:Protein-glutamate methylesterase/protein-glutamine glutaminase n=1 Tax=Caproiciproducens galactitolivorans TaxID=642589 RepID=A0A4Z0Y017_9FIRM|nr:chemotaxis response regulator protein-glutamate methylesterase [Caproiciproducens galactitolivorans]QEY33694.1 chemotaxis response regulator protein-glutamate methylesterase [Caproiciproducens galactitolivorans]TGJ76177.1 chemotaxis response regulator protein-glutamate methylesterase [Caproiciproducens galactitolivorans]
MPINRRVRVLIVDDSLFFRTALQKALLNNPDIEIVGTAGNAMEAEKKIKELSPDVVTLDVEMPDSRGTDFLKKLLPAHPLPVVLVSSLDIGIFEALSAGAVDFVQKPNLKSSEDFAAFSQELSQKIKIASSAKVKKTPAPAASLPLPALSKSANSEHIIAIGASTGGTEATAEILKQLPADIPGILIVQHMPVGFTKMYADRLNKLCKFTVLEAQNGDRVKQGQALVAAGDKHMTLEKDYKGYYVKCAAGEKVSGHCPSVDVMFRSVARTAGKDAIGVILTGMGRDGASGLLEMRKSGSFTIGQDKQTSIVYGMPMVAFDIGAVVKQAPINAIAGIIIQKLNK